MPRGLFPCFGGRSASSEPDAAPTADQAAEEDRRAGPVVAELFSSQGCGTSPEAELLMSRLGRGDSNLDVPVIVLAYHVDYWDYTGWMDPFASSQWTVRQKAYVEALKLDTMFTPQLVVQGAAQCVANDLDAVVSAIRSAPRFPLPTLQATFQRPSPETLQVSLSGALRNKVDSQGATVMVALYESGLVTDYVVRKLEKLCSVKDISAKKTITGTVTFSLWEGFNSRKSGVAVFVQNGSHRVFGAQNFQLPENL